jgi:hypothetical protein
MTTIQKAHEEALKDSKLKSRFRLYDLRHTFGSRSAMAGVDLATLKELMGALQHFDYDAVRSPDTGAQARGASKIGAVQRRTGVRNARKAVGVPTKVPTVRRYPNGQLAEVVVN